MDGAFEKLLVSMRPSDCSQLGAPIRRSSRDNPMPPLQRPLLSPVPSTYLFCKSVTIPYSLEGGIPKSTGGVLAKSGDRHCQNRKIHDIYRPDL